MEKELIVFKDPKSPISEIFRTLRTNIQFMDTTGNAKTILITSTFAGEGKSWVSSNLAASFAQAGNKVLLIDADMRKGRQYTIFGISPKPGLSNCLARIGLNDGGKTDKSLLDYVQKTKVKNLYVMTAGNVPPNPSELLISPRMKELIEESKVIFDTIIIDSTPSQLVTDSIILARIVDSTVIVTASEKTKREDLKRVITNIQNVGGKIVGIVLNKVQISTKRYEEKYYYYGSKSRDVSKVDRISMDNFIRNEKEEFIKEIRKCEKAENKNINTMENKEGELTYINEIIKNQK